MRVFLKPVTLCVVLVVGALPGVVLACQWACDAPTVAASGDAHQHDDHHGSLATQGPADGAIIRGFGHGCDHSPLLEVAVTTAIAQFFAPAAFVVPEVFATATWLNGFAAAAPTATFSPPGVRSSPLPLRI